jgi:hypothetical protein
VVEHRRMGGGRIPPPDGLGHRGMDAPHPATVGT